MRLQEATMGGYKRQPAATKRQLRRGDACLRQVCGLCHHPHAERYDEWFWKPRGFPITLISFVEVTEGPVSRGITEGSQ